MATQREIFSLGASIGNFWFMHFGLLHHSQYQQLIRLFTSTPFSGPSNDLRNVIGISTCIDQDLQALCRDGVHLATSYGADAIPESEAIGHVLFGDQDRVLPEHQVVGNILDLIPSLPKTAGA